MLLKMSVYGGALILFTMIIRFFFVNKLPKRGFICLWILAILRLLIPFDLPITSNFVAANPVISNTSASLDNINTYITTSTSQGKVVNPSASYVDSINWAQIIYILGMILLLLFFIIMYYKEYRRIQAAIPIDKVRNQRLKELVSLPKRATIFISDQVSTPLVFGIIHPRIILPKFLEDKVKLEFALTHEIIHIRRMDNLWKFIMIATLLVHWFNPLVWVMYLYFNRDIEMACDEKTIHLLGENQKKNYAYVLINLAEKHHNCSLFSNGFGNKAVKERVVAIMKFKKMRNVQKIFTSLLIGSSIMLLSACGVSDTSNQSLLCKRDKIISIIKAEGANHEITKIKETREFDISSTNTVDNLNEYFKSSYENVNGISYQNKADEGKNLYTSIINYNIDKMKSLDKKEYIYSLSNQNSLNFEKFKAGLEKADYKCE